MICNPCCSAADSGQSHRDCRGWSWCDCQHATVSRAAPEPQPIPTPQEFSDTKQ